jgi:hypothetical protein
MIEVLLQGTDDINSGQKFQALISRGAHCAIRFSISSTLVEEN